MEQKFREFAFTNYDRKFDYESIKHVKYMIVGKEVCPSTGKKHHQGFISFINPRSFKSVKKELIGFHIESTKKCALANIRYCEKEGNLHYEYGNRPIGQGTRTDMQEVFKKIEEGAKDIDIAKEYPNKWIFHHKAFDRYRNMIEDKRDWVTKLYYIWGNSGTGKTKYAIEKGAIIVNFTHSGSSYFIQGYEGEDIILFDDVDERTFSNHRSIFLQLTDRYPLKVNIKGGERNWKPRKIFITSNYPPCVVFPNKDMNDVDAAVQRRITKIIKL